MPEMTDHELDRLVKEAEWRGQSLAALKALADQLDTMRSDMTSMKKEIDKVDVLEAKVKGINDTVERVSTRINTLVKGLGVGLHGRDKLMVWGSALTAVASIIVALIEHII